MADHMAMAFPRGSDDSNKNTNNDDTTQFSTRIVPMVRNDDIYVFVAIHGYLFLAVSVWASMWIYHRTVRRVPLRLEDMLFYISVTAFYGFTVALYMALSFGGAGYHMNQLAEYHVASLTQSVLVVEALYGLSMCAVKCSTLFMLKRIFTGRYFRIVTWFIIGMQAAWLVMTLLIGFLICRPVEKNWVPTVAGTCGNRLAGYTAVGVVNIIIDLLVFVLPLPVIFQLRATPGYKLNLVSVFGGSLLTIVLSIKRLQAIKSIDFDDFPYTVIDAMTWTVAEVGVSILVAPLTLLGPVLLMLSHQLDPS